MSKMGSPVARGWQLLALEKIKTAFQQSLAKILIAACPGAGKTWLGFFASRAALDDGGCGSALIICPTVNVKEQWASTFNAGGIRTASDISNLTIRERRSFGEELLGEFQGFAITYAQLALDSDLWAEWVHRNNAFVIADEVHHADDEEKFGVALARVAEAARLKLALSGTPFNTKGAALAMCECREETDSEGRRVMRAMPLYEYSYLAAIQEDHCRPVEFIARDGIAQRSWRNLLDGKTWCEVIDLSKKRTSDMLGPLLRIDGAFLPQMLREGLEELIGIRSEDPRAAMLIVAIDKAHGEQIRDWIEEQKHGIKGCERLNVQAIFNDTTAAHARINQLQNDSTDVIVTVRMISEGVDVPRLRVGVYATDTKTRMFFTQFVGRFVRSERRLEGKGQFAKIVIPAHIELLRFAREIERMCLEGLCEEPGEGGGDRKSVNELVGEESEARGERLLYRGAEETDRELLDKIRSEHPEWRGRAPDSLLIEILRALGHGQPQSSFERDDARQKRKLNARLVNAVVQAERGNGKDVDQSAVNSAANRFVGIRRIDDLTTEDVLERRLEFLRNWLRRARGQEADREAA